jgi:single-strand DNA-binding protein
MWVSATVNLRAAKLLDMLTQQDTETFNIGSLVGDKWIDQRNQNRSKLGIAIVLSNIFRDPGKIVG